MDNIINLILSSGPVRKMNLFTKIPKVMSNTSTVYAGDNELYIVATEDRQITRGELMSNKLNFFTIVDMKRYILEFKSDYRSKNGVDGFSVEFEIEFQVENPVGIVRNKIVNANEVIRHALDRKIKKAAQKFFLSEKQQLNEEISKEEFNSQITDELERLGFKIFYLDINIVLTKAEIAAIENERKKQQVKKDMIDQHEIEKMEQKLKFEKEEEKRQMIFNKVNDFLCNKDYVGLKLYFIENKGMLEEINSILDKKKQDDKEFREEYIKYMKIARELDLDENGQVLNIIVNAGVNNTIEEKEVPKLNAEKLDMLMDEDE